MPRTRKLWCAVIVVAVGVLVLWRIRTVHALSCTPRTGYSFCAVITQVHTQIGSTDQNNFPVGLIGTCNGSSGSGFCTSSNVDLRTVGNGGKIQNTVTGFLISGYYSSGGSITGTVNQTCALSGFNNSLSGATATVALTGTNVIAPQTNIVVTANGSGATSDATAATFGNGSATCSGAPAIVTVTQQSVSVPADLVFTSDSSGTTLLDWEIASYTASTGAIEAYVNVTLSHTADTVFYMSFGDASVTTLQDPTTSNTWNSAFVGVFHISNNGLTSGKLTFSRDSTKNALRLTTAGAGNATVAGIAGLAIDTTSTQHLILSTTPPANLFPNGSGTRTLDGWWKHSANFISIEQGFGWGNKATAQMWTVAGCQASPCGLGADSLLTPDYFGASGFKSFTVDGSFHHSVITYPTGQTREDQASVYLDGVAQTVTFSSPATTVATADPHTSGNFCLGDEGNCDGGNPWNGQVDEVRVSNVARSADWVTATFNNFHAPGTFASVGNISTGAAPTQIFLIPPD